MEGFVILKKNPEYEKSESWGCEEHQVCKYAAHLSRY